MVVKATQQTSVSPGSALLTVKGTNTPVQVANSEFYVDPDTGTFRIRASAGASSGGRSRRRLLQQADATARVASADFNVDPSGLMTSANAVSQPSLFASLSSSADFFISGNTSGNTGRHLLQTFNSTTSTPATILPPICDWASSDLFNVPSCIWTTMSPGWWTPEKQWNQINHLGGCLSMTGTCANFMFATKITLPMWSKGLGSSTTPFTLSRRLYVPLSPNAASLLSDALGPS